MAAKRKRPAPRTKPPTEKMNCPFCAKPMAAKSKNGDLVGLNGSKVGQPPGQAPRVKCGSCAKVSVFLKGEV